MDGEDDILIVAPTSRKKAPASEGKTSRTVTGDRGPERHRGRAAQSAFLATCKTVWAVLAGIAKTCCLAARCVVEQPYLVFNTLLAFSVAIGIYATLGVGGIGPLAAKVMSGDLLAMVMALVSATALMCGSLSITVLAERIRAHQHDQNMEKRMISTSQRDNLQIDLAKDIHRIVSYIANKVDADNSQLSTLSIRRPNEPSVWTRLLSGTAYFTVASYALCDVEEYRDADGALRFKPNKSRIATWLPRFIGDTKLGRVEHVFLQAPEKLDSDFVPTRPMLRVLAAYKTLAKIAHANGLAAHFDLSRVRVRVCSSEIQISQAFFVGTKKPTNADSKPSPFVYRYDVLMLIANLPQNLFARTIEQSYDPVEVEAYLQTARALVDQAARTFRIEELLDRFDYLIPEIDPFDAVLDLDTRATLGLPLTESEARTVAGDVDDMGVLDFGDGSFRT